MICDLEKLDDRGYLSAPDLIEEVLSISTMKKNYNEKFNLYQENDVKEYWLDHPEAYALQVFHLKNEEHQ